MQLQSLHWPRALAGFEENVVPIASLTKHSHLCLQPDGTFLQSHPTWTEHFRPYLSSPFHLESTEAECPSSSAA